MPWEGKGYKPVGYGFDSVSAILGAIHRIENETASLSDGQSLQERQGILKDIDARGIIATPANSHINELVTEAARTSILNNGEAVKIPHEKYQGGNGSV